MFKPHHFAALIAINMVFAGSYIAGKFGVNHLPPLFFSALRFLLVFVVLLPFFRLRPALACPPKLFFGFCLSMGVGVYSTMYLGLSLSGGVSAIMIGTQFSVPAAALLSMILLGATVSKTSWLGIMLAFCGVMIVGFDEAILGYGLSFLCILLSALFYGYANVVSKQLGGAVNVLNLNAWMALLSAPIMFVVSLLFEDNQWALLASADTTVWIAILFSALVVSLVGHGGMFALLRRYPVAMVMPYYVLTPIFGVLGSVYFFDEVPTVKFYAGAVIALLGVWIVNRRTGARAD